MISRTALVEHYHEHNLGATWQCNRFRFKDERVRVAHYLPSQKTCDHSSVAVSGVVPLGTSGRADTGNRSSTIPYPPKKVCMICQAEVALMLALGNHNKNDHDEIVQSACSNCNQFEYRTVSSISSHYTRCLRGVMRAASAASEGTSNTEPSSSGVENSA